MTQNFSFGPGFTMSYTVIDSNSNPGANSDLYPPGFMNFINGITGGNPSFPFGMTGGNSGMGVPFGTNYHDLLDRLMQQHQPRGTPPVANDVLSRLPHLKITEEDVSKNTDCSVCKDTFNLNEEVLKLPCEHLYHQDCIMPWLKQHNTCPTCRYELPTSDNDYEQERKKRMASRHIDEEDLLAAKSAKTSPSEICEFSSITKEDCSLSKPEITFTSLSCGHLFHSECLEDSLRITGSLPEETTLSQFTSSFPCPSCKCETTILRPLELD